MKIGGQFGHRNYLPIGYIPWNKGKKKADFPQLSNSGVKKGNIPWNKNKKMIMITGENHYLWKKDRSLIKGKQDRNNPEYKQWVKKCKKRDNCKCKINNDDCNGYCIVHHILPWSNHPELRYNINNGITLCQFHHPKKRDEEQKLIPFFQNLVEVIKN